MSIFNRDKSSNANIPADLQQYYTSEQPAWKRWLGVILRLLLLLGLLALLIWASVTAFNKMSSRDNAGDQNTTAEQEAEREQIEADRKAAEEKAKQDADKKAAEARKAEEAKKAEAERRKAAGTTGTTSTPTNGSTSTTPTESTTPATPPSTPVLPKTGG